VAAPELDPDDRHHLERVLRLRAGESVTVADGRGGWRECAFVAGGGLQPVGEVELHPRPEPAITIAFALTKADKPELTVQKLTELGVDRILPFTADRSVVRWDADRAQRQVERLRRVAREAAMQSRRAFLPEVGDVVRFDDVVGLPGVCRADAGGGPPTLRHPVVLVGPEGGWSDAERCAPVPIVGLGAQVLRAETASIAAAALLGALRAGLVAHGGSLPERG
jgi:16S rRNA (uracil1498-N3)-methyltransferase